MKFRKSHVDKLVEAQREFDRAGPDLGKQNKAAAVIGALFRNASNEERRAFQARCGPDGRARD